MSLTARLEEARVAGMFLTRLPMGRVARIVPMAETAWAWPLAGALLGAIFGAVHWALTLYGLPAPVVVILAMSVTLLASGALHEDGLADLADGLGGGADPARRLAIMRDSRLGSYGAMALILAFGLGFCLWSAVPTTQVWQVAVALGAISRMALPLWLRLFPSARAEGLGAQGSKVQGWRIGVSLALGAGIAALLLPPAQALALTSTCLGLQALLCLYTKARLGGITGDVMGAAQVLGTLAALLAWVGG